MPIVLRALSRFSYLLTVDEAAILLDCGSYEDGIRDFEIGSSDQIALEEQDRYLSVLKEIAPSLTLILISNPLPSSLGCLPFLITHTQLSPTCQIYASPPTISLAKLCLREWASALCTELDPGLFSTTVRTGYTQAELDAVSIPKSWKFTPAQLSKVLSRLSPIRFSSPLLLVGRNAPLTLLANRAGHTLGGTVWTLRTPTTEEITYAPVFNHVRERSLDAADTLLSRESTGRSKRQKGITLVGANRAKHTAPKSNARNKGFIDAILETLRSSNSVLVPIDAAGRAIELLVLLDQQWTFHNLQQFPLCFVSRTKDDLVLALKTLQEYFGTNLTPLLPSVGALAANNDVQPDLLKHVKFFASPAELQAAFPIEQPKCILSVPSTISYGFSRTIFAAFGTVPGNMVVLPSKEACEPGSLASYLFKKWQEGQEGTDWGNPAGRIGHVVDLNGEVITITMHRKILLEGEELHTYQQQQKQEAQSRAKERAVIDRKRRLDEAAQQDSDDDDSSDDGSDDGLPEMPAKKIKMDLESDTVMNDITNLAVTRRKGFVGDAEVGAADSIGSNHTFGLLSNVGVGIYDEFLDGLTGPQSGSFDIYVRGQQARRPDFTEPIAQEDGHLIFPPLRDLPRTKMFPFVDRRRRVDAYGEIIDVQAWQSRGRVEGENQVVEMSTINQTRRKRDEEATKDRIEPPHKYVKETLTLTLNCSVLAIDFEAKADGKALKALLPHLNPKKLVLLGGDSDSMGDLKAACSRSSTMTKEILTPLVDEIIQIGEDIRSFSIRLDDELLSTIAMQKVENYEVIRLDGALNFTDISSIPAIRGSAVNAEGILDKSHLLLQSFQAPEPFTLVTDGNEPRLLPTLRPSTFIGDIRLASLRARLQAMNVPAAFAGEGVLVCGPIASKTARPKENKSRIAAANKASATPELEVDTAGGQVAVRKMQAGELLIEGQPGETYQAVREVVYAMHAAAD